MLNVRELQVEIGKEKLVLQVHQPRLADLPACTNCLNDWHRSSKCPFKTGSEAAEMMRLEKRQPRVLSIQVEDPEVIPYDPKPISQTEFLESLDRFYVRAEPEALKARLVEATAIAAATAAEVDLARAEAQKTQILREAAAIRDALEAPPQHQAESAIPATDGPPKTSKKSKKQQKRAQREAAALDAAHAAQLAAQEAAQAQAVATAAQAAAELAKRHELARAAEVAAAAAQSELEEAERVEAELAAAQATAAATLANRAAAATALRQAALDAATRVTERPAGNLATAQTTDRLSPPPAAAMHPNVVAAAAEAACAQIARAEAEAIARGLVEQAVAAAEAAAAAAAEHARAAADAAATTSPSDVDNEEMQEWVWSEDDGGAASPASTQAPAPADAKAGKRGRIDTADDPLNETLTERPPTRLARAYTGHEYVGQMLPGSLRNGSLNVQRADLKLPTKPPTAAGDTPDATVEDQAKTDVTDGATGDKALSGGSGTLAALGELGALGDLDANGALGELGELGERGELGALGESGEIGELGERNANEDLGGRGAHGEPDARGATGELGEHSEADGSDDSRTDRPANSRDQTEGDEQAPEAGWVGKRTRVDTMDNPTHAQPPTDKPPTRQARANTAHTHVTALDGAPRIRQLSVAKFFRQVDASATAQVAQTATADVAPAPQPSTLPGSPSGDDVQLVHVLPATDALARYRFEDLCARLGLHEIRTPAQGSCLQAAIYAAKALSCPATVTTRTRAVADKIQELRSGIAAYLMVHWSHLIATESISLERASILHLDTADVDDTTSAKLLEHFAVDGEQDCCATLPFKYWGSGIHIAATAHWCQEIIYVWDVLPEGHEYQVLCRRYAYHPDRDAVTETPLTISEMVTELEIHKANEVLPVILTLHQNHTKDLNLSHFQALRLEQKWYSKWARTTALVKGMQARRLHVAHTILQAPGTAPRPPDHTHDTLSPPETEGSAYVPSATESGTGHGEAREASSAPNFSLLPPCVQRDDAMHEDRSHHSSSPHSEDIAAARVATPAPLLSLPSAWSQSLSSTPCSPVTPLSPADLVLLLARLQAQQVDPSDAAHALFERATEANNLQYAIWRRQLAVENSPLAQRLDGCATLRAACATLDSDAMGMTHMLRALPYALVLIPTLSDRQVVRIGRAAAWMGRLQLLHRLRGDCEVGTTTWDFCTQWMNAVEADVPLKTREALLLDNNRWSRLRALSSSLRLPALPSRVHAVVSESNWHRLLAVAVADSSYLPRPLQTTAAPQLMDALLMWLGAEDQLTETATVAASLANRDWDALVALCPEEHPPYVPRPLRARPSRTTEGSSDRPPVVASAGGGVAHTRY